MSLQILLLILTFLLIGLFCSVAVSAALGPFQGRETKKQKELARKGFFYTKLSNFFFPTATSEIFYFANLFAQNLLRFFYAILSVIIVAYIRTPIANENSSLSSLETQRPTDWLYLIGFFLILFLIGDYLAYWIGNRYPRHSIKLCGPIVSCFLVLFFPLIFILLKVFNIFPKITAHQTQESSEEAKQKLMDIIEEFNLSTRLDSHDKKLLESVLEFKDRIAREVMVPRVDIFGLPSETTLEKAAKFLYQEGYSRTPVYKDNLDNIVGVLMYKDVLAKYMEYGEKKDPKLLLTPISTILKNVLYTPETKKISQLLQEFRKKQVHLAIIVDEYGGTEGIVTIEDILEEIVGDIADEYDEMEALFLPLSEGGWLIDARMSIFDVEEQVGIEIPQDGDYDTIGGYVFHETGMIPPKGYIITQPQFEIEVIRSNDRRVEKLRIKSLIDIEADNNKD